jgi:hypothetical protein
MIMWLYVILPWLRKPLMPMSRTVSQHFDDLPTWKPSFPHNIKRITRQNQKCNNCHGNESIFLSKADLATWETLANIGVVVPENRIPKRIEEGKE